MKNHELREERKEYKIREATPADAEEIARIRYNSWLVTYPNEVAGITRDDVQIHLGDLAKCKEDWGRNLKESSKDIKTFVAEDAGRVVGFCAVARQDKENHLNALYLDLAYEGKGVASKIFKEAMQFFGETNPVTLEVAAYNDRAKLFYERKGFREVQRTMDPDKINGKDMPILLMRRPGKGDK